jgi:hypothetical protein
MSKRIFTSIVTASVLMLGLHAAAPVSQAATFNAGCTAIAHPASVINGQVVGTFTISCAAPQSAIRIDGSLAGGNENTVGGGWAGKTCYNAASCSVTTSAPYFAGDWTTVTSGYARSGWTFQGLSAETTVSL